MLIEPPSSKPSANLPDLIRASGSKAEDEYINFFTAGISNANTRLAYVQAISGFMRWASALGFDDLARIKPMHVAAWREHLLREHSIATVKLRLAALRSFFNWLVLNQAIETNPASPVRSPREVLQRGKTPVLEQSEASQLIAAIDTTTLIGLRDRALIGTMFFTFARVGAALTLRVRDLFTQQGHLWLRFHEKGGKVHEMPCQPTLVSWLNAYIDKAGIGSDRDSWLFRSFDRLSNALSSSPLAPSNAYAMVKRRAHAANLEKPVCNHSFRAMGITAYLSNGGNLEMAAKLANHSCTRTTQLYDRRDDSFRASELDRVSLGL